MQIQISWLLVNPANQNPHCFSTCGTVIFYIKQICITCIIFKAAYSVTMNIFGKKYFLFKSFVKVELSYVFTIKMISTAENCIEK